MKKLASKQRNRYLPDMNKQDVKMWLRSIGKDREWLAEQIGVKKRSVDNWLSSHRDIAAKAQIIIARLMTQHPASVPLKQTDESPNEESALVITTDASTFDLWNEAALLESKLLRQWAADVLTNYAEERVDRAKA